MSETDLQPLDRFIPRDDALMWIGAIGIGKCADGSLWLMRDTGEGLQLRNLAPLEHLLMQFFAENF